MIIKQIRSLARIKSIYLYAILFVTLSGLGILILYFQITKQAIVSTKVSTMNESQEIKDSQSLDDKSIISPPSDKALHEASLSTALDKYSRLNELAQKTGYPLGPTISGANNLDYRALNQYEEYMKTEGTTYVNAESVVIWFNNFPSDKLTLDQRKKLAFDKLSLLRSRIVSGEITMRQAGAEIQNDQSLRLVDEAWESNAYREIIHAKKSEKTFFDPTVQSLLWSMKPGELSPILTGSLIDNGIATSEAYYSLLKINKHEVKAFDSFIDFMNSK